MQKTDFRPLKLSKVHIKPVHLFDFLRFPTFNLNLCLKERETTHQVIELVLNLLYLILFLFKPVVIFASLHS